VDVKSKHLPPDRVLEASPSSSSSSPSCMLVAVVHARRRRRRRRPSGYAAAAVAAEGEDDDDDDDDDAAGAGRLLLLSWILLAGGVGIEGRRSSLPQRPHPTQDDLTDGDGVQSGRRRPSNRSSKVVLCLVKWRGAEVVAMTSRDGGRIASACDKGGRRKENRGALEAGLP
jgi:hypothetical protein